MAVVLLPPFLNYVALTKEEQHLKPAVGELYDVGWGQRLFLSCSGSGRPTVVLDAPTGASSDAWRELAPMVAKLTRVCVYDRAGLGFSERPATAVAAAASDGASTAADGQQRPDDDDGFAPSSAAAAAAGRRSQPYTVERMAEDLHRLVTQASQQPQPLVLVGSGVGALVAKFYAQFYDSEVAAVALVDPPVDALFADSGWSSHWYDRVVPSVQALQLLAATGLTRLALITGLMAPPPLPTPGGGGGREESAEDDAVFAARQKFLMCHPRHLKTAVDEHYLMNETLVQMRILSKVKPFPANVSVALVTRQTYDETLPQFDALWRSAYADAKLSLQLPTHTATSTLSQSGPSHVYDGRASRKLLKLIADLVVNARNRQAA